MVRIVRIGGGDFTQLQEPVERPRRDDLADSDQERPRRRKPKKPRAKEEPTDER